MMQYKRYENIAERKRVYLHLVDATDGITPETGEAGGQPKLSINGGTPVSTSGTLVAVDVTTQPGTYYVQLTGGELNTLGIHTVRYKSANTAEFVDVIQVIENDPYEYSSPLGPGVFGPDIDYKKIKKMIDEAIKSIPRVEVKEPDLVPISEGLQALLTEIRAIDLPEADKVDLEPVLSALRAVEGAVADINIPETDLKPVLDRLDHAVDELEPQIKESDQTAQKMLERMRVFFETDLGKIHSGIGELKAILDKTQMVVLADKETSKQPPNKESVLKEYLNLPK